MPQNLVFTLTGNHYFTSTSVSFQVVFENAGDESFIKAYEWYLDDILIIDATGKQFSGYIACGKHSIGVRMLNGYTWTGIQQVTFETCKVISSAYITGPNTLNSGNSTAFHVIWEFNDGTLADVTDLYTFTSDVAGSFAGNVFTDDGSVITAEPVVITAEKNGMSTLTKAITVYNTANSAGLLVVDLFNNSSLNLIGFVDNAEVAESHIAAYTGTNIIPAASANADALILASDYIDLPDDQPGLSWRYIFNLAKLKVAYPASESFVFYLKGQGNANSIINGSFLLKNMESTMSMNGSPGTYLPVNDDGGVLMSGDFASEIVDGANGSYDEADLTMVIALTYDVASNSITYVTNKNPIVVDDFDFMAVKYSWGEGGGADLDILVGFENNGTQYDGSYVGFGQPNATVPADTVPQQNAYLWWGTDNTSTAGSENALIGIRKFIEDFPSSPDIIEVGLYAVWYHPPGSGDFAVELVTYKGGEMSREGTDFVNTGGTQVSSNTVNVNTLINNTSHTPANAYKVGNLKYTKSTQSAVIEIV